MAHSCTHVYVHYVWATLDRGRFITPALEVGIYACITKKCQNLRCQLIAIGGTEDHVHALVRLHSTVSVALAAKEMKGASSHFVTHLLAPGQTFQWQETYGAFSVSPGDLQRVRAYIQGQKEHHGSGRTQAEWERCAEA